MAKPDDKNRTLSFQRGAKAPTMASVGRLAGVSQVTVSRALSDPSKVSAETLSRINEAIRITGFVPNAVAGALASQKSKLVSALVPSITNPIYSSMIGPFSARLRAKGYQILLSETGLDPEEEYLAVQKHLSRRPDAVLLTGVQHSTETRRLLLAAGIPVVEVWEVTNTPIDICVGFDHVGAGVAAAEFAFSKGYRDAAVISAHDRRAGLRMRAFAGRFAALGGEVFASCVSEQVSGLIAGRSMMADLAVVHSLRPNSFVFCSSDTIAHGALIEAKARGLHVPEDIAVMGFGDQDFAGYIDPPLATIRVDRESLGRTAADAILDRIENVAHESPVFDVGFSVIERTSVRDLNLGGH